jgi:hypothetical protein
MAENNKKDRIWGFTYKSREILSIIGNSIAILSFLSVFPVAFKFPTENSLTLWSDGVMMGSNRLLTATGF